jgi:hypothetical protein
MIPIPHPRSNAFSPNFAPSNRVIFHFTSQNPLSFLSEVFFKPHQKAQKPIFFTVAKLGRRGTNLNPQYQAIMYSILQSSKFYGVAKPPILDRKSHICRKMKTLNYSKN